MKKKVNKKAVSSSAPARTSLPSASPSLPLPVHHAHKGLRINGSVLKDIILGGQDGLVNVLGIVLAVAIATQDTRIVLIAGFAATFAESISMAAVAYTSSKAARDYYVRSLDKTRGEIHDEPVHAEQEIRHYYFKKGFRGRFLERIVAQILHNPDLTFKTLVEAHNLSSEDYASPVKDAFIVGFAALLGSVIPLAPFFVVAVKPAMIAALIISSAALFVVGAYKAAITVGRWWRSGLEMMLIGMAAAISGFAVGYFFGAL